MIPKAPGAYDQNNEAQAREALRQMDEENLKRGRDLELPRGARLILPDSVTGDRYHVDIQSGVVVLVAL